MSFHKNKKETKSIIRLIKKFSLNQKIFSIFSVLLLLGITSLIFNFNKVKAPFPISTSSLISSSHDIDASDWTGLGSIEKHMVPNSKGTVVYFPQIHKEPTTQAVDKKNDQAAVAQRQIYNALNIATDKYGVGYVMDETDLYGAMPQEKIQKIQNGFSDIENFKVSRDQVIANYLNDGGSKAVVDKLMIDSIAAIDAYERNLYLTGGAAVLAVKNENSHVYGSQNRATLDEAKKQLENITYLENRINQLKSKTAISPVKNSTTLTLDQVSSLVSGSKQVSTTKMFNGIAAFATQNGNTELSSDIEKAKNGLSKLSTSKKFEGMQKYSDVPHVANPYESNNNLNALQSEYKQVYPKFMALIKDQRSQEVSDNVEKMMDENNVDSAALVFGAQHKDQIVDALNKKGISVIVVTTEAVSNHK